jgi:hypothetical protein
MRLFFSGISLLVLASLSPAIAQSVSVGLKAGARLGDEFNDTNGTLFRSSDSRVEAVLDIRLR